MRQRVAGWDIDGSWRASCRCSLEKDHDGCCVLVCSRRRETGFADSFQILAGEMTRKVLDSWNREVPLGYSRSG